MERRAGQKMGTAAFRTRYGAKQPLREIIGRLTLLSRSEIVISYGHPGWHHDLECGQTREESDTLMEEYLQDPDIRSVFIEGDYAYTVWNNRKFSKYVGNLGFSESYLIWIPEAKSDEVEYPFHFQNWSLALFAYEGRLFYEVFQKKDRVPMLDGEKEIEYPGSIGGPGGIGIRT